MTSQLSIRVVAAIALAAGGCCSSASGPAEAPPRATPGDSMQRLTGTLRSGLMGIGGEHTGWAMLVPGEGSREKQVEVDVSKVAAMARAMDGKSVTAEGTYVEKRYVERGPTRIFQIERFWTCFEPGT
ncbi:MAG: hypothetical protein KF699_11095 [Phycisphaeraceae bacterium]|nr:hypothetical protein [Phycisphaeraceae bacterium]